MKLNLAAPIEDGIGYGICGTNLAIELSRITNLNITSYLDQASVHRPIELNWLCPRIKATATDCDPDLPTIYVQDVGDRPPGNPVMLYTCTDTERLSQERIDCYRQMDVLVGMSAWNLEAFEDAGFTNCEVILQGFDETLFFPRDDSRRVFDDRYVFFSGGKFEYRKGQDIVLAAWKIFHPRHPDSLLVTGWYNAWPHFMKSMSLTSHIELTMIEHFEDLPSLLPLNDIDPESVIFLQPLPNWTYAQIYHQCDCGLFPTRGEPATNMPMVEMMACGKPVIASYCGGQADVLQPDDNCRALTDLGREPASHERPMKEDLGQWWSPCVEELVAQMEWCFEHREEAGLIGRRAASDVRSHMTWKHTARHFVQLAEKVTSPVAATA